MRRAFAGVGLTLLLVLGIVAVLLHRLDDPRVKRQVQRVVREQAGLDLDYGALEVSVLSGLRIRDIVVLSPEPYTGVAPELVRLGELKVSWSPTSLLAARLHEVTLRHLALTLVREDDGSLSLPAGAPQPPDSPGAHPQQPPPVPLSHLMASLLTSRPPLREVMVEDIQVTIHQRGPRPTANQGPAAAPRAPPGPPAETLHLGGLALDLAVERIGLGRGYRVRLHGGTQATPLALALRRDKDGKTTGASAQLWLSIVATPTEADATVDLRVTDQTLAPAVHTTHPLHLEVKAEFKPKAGRTLVTLSRTELADGALTADASLELPDDAKAFPALHKAHGAIDLVRLLAIDPAGLVPLTAKKAAFTYDLADLELAATPRLSPAGHADIEGEVDAVHLAQPGGGVAVGQGKLSLKAEPAADHATALHLSLPLRSLRVDSGGERLSASSLSLLVTGHGARSGENINLTGVAEVKFSGIERSGAQRVALRDGHVALHASDLLVDPAAPLGTRGKLGVTALFDGLDLSAKNLHAQLESTTINLQTHLTGHPPYALELEVPVRGMHLADGKGRTLAGGDPHLSLHLSEVRPDAKLPARSRADASLDFVLGSLQVKLDAKKHEGSLDYDINASATSLALLRPFVTGAAAQAPWERMGFALRSVGNVEHLESRTPRISHKIELHLDHPALKGQGSADSVALLLNSSGTARRHTGDVDLQVRGLSAAGQSVGDVHLTLSAGVDADAPSLKLRLASEEQARPQVLAAVALSFERGDKALTYDVDLRLGRLGPLIPLISRMKAAKGVDLTALSVELDGKGKVLGLFTGVSGGAPKLSPHPLATMGVAGTLNLRASGLSYSVGDSIIKTPGMAWRGTLSLDGDRRLVHADLSLDELHVTAGEHQVDVKGFKDDIQLTATGDLALGQLEVVQKLTLGSVKQDYAPGYAVGDATAALHATRDADGVIRIPELRLDNRQGGTAFALSGRMDLGEDRRTLGLHGMVNQQLTPLWSDRKIYAGRGDLAMEVQLDSGNMALYHMVASMTVSGAHIELPRSGIVVDGFDGSVPLVADLLVDKKGVHLLRDAQHNAYSRLRFADQHPLLSVHSFISVASIVMPKLTISGLAGNLKIEHNLISMNQLEMGVRDGQVSGQCLIDWGETDAVINLRLRGTRLRASTGERFDGNTAIVLSARDRDVEGRAEILHIGKHHLLDLLDLQDPSHTDAAMNRIRSTMAVGYPERVSLVFAHGFASFEVIFGGLASLVHLDKIKGIPMGPMIDKMIPKGSDREDGP